MKRLNKVWFIALAFGLVAPTLPAHAADVKTPVIQSIEGKQVQIRHLEKNVVSNERLSVIVAEASQAIKDDKDSQKLSRSTGGSGTYDFVSGGSGITYVYEETQNADPVLIVADQALNAEVQEQVAAKSNGVFGTESVGNFDIADGIGGKQNITLTNSTYLSAVLQLPATADAGSWNYGGFDYNSGTATYSGEMGLQYYSNLGVGQTSKGWKPVLTFAKQVGQTKTVYNVSLDDAYNQVQYHNGYAQGASINYYTYYNNGSGNVRMKLTGSAICSDLNCNTTAPTTLTTIIQTDQAVGLTSINNYKLISSIVTSATSGNNTGVFSSIKVGTTSVPSANFSTPLIDHATITRNASNTLTIACDH